MFLFCVIMWMACNSADKKIPEMAAAYCECMSGANNTFSREAQDVIMAAAKAEDSQSGLYALIQELPAEKRAVVIRELNEIENSPMGICLKKTDEKYRNERTQNERKFMKKLIAELKNKANCGFAAAFISISTQK